MPTPLLHSAVAVAIARATLRERFCWKLAAIAAGLAVLPDMDLLPGILSGDPVRFHHGATHSLLFAVVTALAASRLAQGGEGAPRRVWVLLLASLSHTALDLFNYEATEPVVTVLATQPLFWPLKTRVWPLAQVFASAPIPPDPKLWFTSTFFGIVLRELALGAAVLVLAWRLPDRAGASAPAEAGVGAES